MSFGPTGLAARVYGCAHAVIVDRFAPYRALHAEVVAAVGDAAAPGARVLDLLCGPGSLTLALATAGFRVTGAEMFPALLEMARRRAAGRGVQNAEFVPLPPGPRHALPRDAFDHVVSVHALYAHPDPDTLLSTAREALKSGAHATFVNFARPAKLVDDTRGLARRGGWRAAAAGLVWLAPNAMFEALRAPGPAHFWREDELAQRLEGAGFRVLELRRTFVDAMSLLARAQKR